MKTKIDARIGLLKSANAEATSADIYKPKNKLM